MRMWNEAAASVVAATKDVEIGRRWQLSTIVRTPLELVVAMERVDASNARVILAGDFAKDRAFATFLEETYPAIDVVVVAERHERAVFVPAYA